MLEQIFGTKLEPAITKNIYKFRWGLEMAESTKSLHITVMTIAA
jgi:hypothetical protein